MPTEEIPSGNVEVTTTGIVDPAVDAPSADVKDISTANEPARSLLSRSLLWRRLHDCPPTFLRNLCRTMEYA
jgi:hypothetical protein